MEGCGAQYSLLLLRPGAATVSTSLSRQGEFVLPTDLGSCRSRSSTSAHECAAAGSKECSHSPSILAIYRNHRFFVNYVGRDGNIHIGSFRTHRGFAIPRSLRNILTVTTINKDPYSHYGGALVFGPDGRLYASFGDSGDASSSQTESTLLGKLVRIDVDHPGRLPVVVAYGLRNPWRFSFDRATGTIYIGDAGGDRREEVNRLPRNMSGKANFGWDYLRREHSEKAGSRRAPGCVGQAVRGLPPPAAQVQLGYRRIRLQRKQSPVSARPICVWRPLWRRMERQSAAGKGCRSKTRTLRPARSPLLVRRGNRRRTLRAEL